MVSTRLRGALSTTDKRIVAFVAPLFLVAFTLTKVTIGLAQISYHCVEVIYGGALLRSRELPGLFTDAASSRVCATDPLTTGQLWLKSGTTIPGLVFGAGALLLLCWFLWGAVRPGLHARVAPGRLRALGWFVLVGGPLSQGLQDYFRYAFLENLVAGTKWVPSQGTPWLQELQMDFPWWSVFAGVSALVVAKLLRIEVQLGEEVEGTI